MQSLLAVFALAVVFCSGCSTVSHLDPGAQAPANAVAPAAPSAKEIPANASEAHAYAAIATQGVRTRGLNFKNEPSLWPFDSAAHGHLTLAPVDSSAGSNSDNSPPFNPFSKAYVGLVWDNIKSTFTTPAHWDTRDWLIFGGVAAGVGTVAVFDEDIQRAVQRNRNNTVDDFFSSIQGFGNEYAPGVIGAFYVGGMIFHDPEAKSVALDATSASIIASGFVLYPLKYTVGRARPGDNLGAYHFQPFGGSDSFPSGHTTEAFVLATVIAEHYHSIWITMGCYGIASAVGYARLDLNYHWASDVLAGAAIGTFVGHLVVHVNQNRWGVALQPVISPTMNGAQISLSF